MKANSTRCRVLAVFLLITAREAFTQGTFQNLDFEMARIIPIVGGPNYRYDIATTNALPAWNAFIGSSQVPQITYNDPALGSTYITLWATNGAQISGNFSVLLQGGLTASAASISQSGLVPVSAESLLFEAQAGSGTLLVSLGGQNLVFSALSNGANYTLYGADVSAFAGQTAQLMFSALEFSTSPNNWNIDNIQFSNQPTPEPGALVLSVLGASIAAWRFTRRRRSQ